MKPHRRIVGPTALYYATVGESGPGLTVVSDRQRIQKPALKFAEVNVGDGQLKILKETSKKKRRRNVEGG